MRQSWQREVEKQLHHDIIDALAQRMLTRLVGHEVDIHLIFVVLNHERFRDTRRDARHSFWPSLKKDGDYLHSFSALWKQFKTHVLEKKLPVKRRKSWVIRMPYSGHKRAFVSATVLKTIRDARVIPGRHS